MKLNVHVEAMIIPVKGKFIDWNMVNITCTMYAFKSFVLKELCDFVETQRLHSHGICSPQYEASD